MYIDLAICEILIGVDVGSAAGSERYRSRAVL